MNISMQEPPSSNISILRYYGFNKYQLADMMRNHFHIHDKYLEGLAIYKVIHMSGIEGFKFMLHDGIVQYGGIEYSVIYHKCTPYLAKRAREVRLSFRKAHIDFMLEPIALVEIVRQD